MKALIILSLLASFSSIVPQPQSVIPAKGSFKAAGTPIKCDPAIDARTFELIHSFAAELSLAGGRTCTTSRPVGIISAINDGTVKGMVFVMDNSLKPESYSLDIKPKAAVVRASDYNGFFYAIQTMKQLLPASIYGPTPDPEHKFILPCGTVRDTPRFSYRGMHLDCGRHFWSVDEVKKYLKAMSMYKLNRFHWHLTEDQGWRIEIKKYPLLTDKGSMRKGSQVRYNFSEHDGIPYGQGMYYTQDEIRDVVAYAETLGIEIIPEVDLPGHMLAALAAYPWLGCTGGPYEVATQWGVFPDVLCPGKESTFEFLEDVLSEIADLFPSRYFHIGGDECPKDRWEACPHCQARIAELGLKDSDKFTKEQQLQAYVTNRMQKFLSTKGKKIIGWDEILEGDLEDGATVMSWRGVEGGIEAASKGFDAIMTPAHFCYFDYAQHEDMELEPISIGSGHTIEVCYSYEPLDGSAPGTDEHIIGVQANLWTEYITEDRQLEYMLLPRLLALSEVQWCPKGSKDWDRLKADIINHQFKVLDCAGYTYSKVLLGKHGYED